MNESERSITPRFGREWMINLKKMWKEEFVVFLLCICLKQLKKGTKYLL